MSVTVPICFEAQQNMHRSTDENAVADVNVFLVKEQEVLLHNYTASSLVRFSFPAGQYRLYVIVNHHADLGDLGIEELLGFSLHSREGYDDLPMTAISDIVISPSNEEQILSPVVVRRSVAKINYNIEVASSQNIHLSSVQVMSLPDAYRPFSDQASGSSGAYENGRIRENPTGGAKMSGSFYMLPNLRGTVPQITAPQQKNTQTAPAHATCIRIRATRDSKVLDYIVYLGENDTSDFNIRPNTSYTLNITIRNDNEADVRITSYTVDVGCEMKVEPENGIYLSMAPIHLTARVSGSFREAGLYCEIKVNAGDPKVFDVNGKTAAMVKLPLDKSNGTNDFFISYRPVSITSGNCILSFTVNIFDRHGLVRSYDYTYRFAAKTLKVYTQWFDGGNGSGVLSSTDAVKVVQQITLSSTYYLFYCTQEGCTILSEPYERFRGFYRSHDLKEFLGSDKYFHFNPTSPTDTIYAYFY